MASRDLPRPTFQGDDTPLNPPDVPVEKKTHELSGEQQQGEQVAYLRQDEVSGPSTEFNDTAQYEGYPTPGSVGDGLPRLEELTDRELREGETDDPAIAAAEGLTWVPPTDPPVVADYDDPQGAQAAAGFGVTAEDFEERIRAALRADAATTQYADALAIATRNGTVAVRGAVDDIDDTDNVIDVISRVTGVRDVIDELEVPGVTD